jgi:hypothetical protein
MQSVRERSQKPSPLRSYPGPVGRREPAERVAYLDNLKLGLVATIIAGHGALA